jgi:flavin reductase (DIM6/NTAB) family NADH-FMN oxidoreductase RutF
MIRKKPWNRVNLPVYSISSRFDNMYNMNICTYTSAVSMKPKQLMVAIYNDTKTLEIVNNSTTFVLQLLAAKQYRMVDLLGKKSGKNIDKISRLEKRELMAEWNGYKILKDALALIELEVVNTMQAEDHTLFLCTVIDYKNLNEGEALTLDNLREHRLIRS